MSQAPIHTLVAAQSVTWSGCAVASDRLAPVAELMVELDGSDMREINHALSEFKSQHCSALWRGFSQPGLIHCRTRSRWRRSRTSQPRPPYPRRQARTRRCPCPRRKRTDNHQRTNPVPLLPRRQPDAVPRARGLHRGRQRHAEPTRRYDQYVGLLPLDCCHVARAIGLA